MAGPNVARGARYTWLRMRNGPDLRRADGPSRQRRWRSSARFSRPDSCWCGNRYHRWRWRLRHQSVPCTDCGARSCLSIPPREGATPWPAGAAWRNAAIDAIAKSSRRKWKQAISYHRHSLVETLMYRLKSLTGSCLWAREIGSQATEVSIRAGVLNSMTAITRPQSVHVA